MSDSLKKRLAPFIVTRGKDFRLKDHSSDNKTWTAPKKATKKLLQKGTELLRDRQEKLYAQNQKNFYSGKRRKGKNRKHSLKRLLSFSGSYSGQQLRLSLL